VRFGPATTFRTRENMWSTIKQMQKRQFLVINNYASIVWVDSGSYPMVEMMHYLRDWVYFKINNYFLDELVNLSSKDVNILI